MKKDDIFPKIPCPMGGRVAIILGRKHHTGAIAMPPRDNDLQADARLILREDFGITDELLLDEIIDEMGLCGEVVIIRGREEDGTESRR